MSGRNVIETRRARALTVRLALLLALGLGGVALAGCGTEAQESNVPLNVLPAEGQATVYEFYTDS